MLNDDDVVVGDLIDILDAEEDEEDVVVNDYININEEDDETDTKLEEPELEDEVEFDSDGFDDVRSLNLRCFLNNLLIRTEI